MCVECRPGYQSLSGWAGVLAGLVAPIFLKKAIDALGGSTITQAAVHASIVALLWSGACRVLSTLAKEIQGPVFTPVSQVSRM